MRVLIIIFIGLDVVYALEVIKTDFHRGDIVLNIVRVVPDSFESYILTNHNGREMLLVCANNRAFDSKKYAFIRYRNFYNVIAYDFKIDRNEVCLDMAKFIELTQFAVDEERPFTITLDRKDKRVTKIIYPDIDPMADSGDYSDLFPKERILIVPKEVPRVQKLF